MTFEISPVFVTADRPEDAQDDSDPRDATADESPVRGLYVTESSGSDVDGWDTGQQATAKQGRQAEPEGVPCAAVGESLEVVVRRSRRAAGWSRRVGLGSSHETPVHLAIRG